MPVKKADSVGSKLTTKWINLYKSRLRPVQMMSKDYRPYHVTDRGTHTKIVITPQNVKTYLENTGGGFIVDLKPSERQVALWQEFQKEELELVDLRCDVCEKELPNSPQHLHHHLKPHKAGNGQVRKGGRFRMTFAKYKPLEDETEAFEDVGGFDEAEMGAA